MSTAFRLGAFIIFTLLIFAAAIFWIGDKQFVFNSKYRLNADFDNVAGLNDGSVVRVGGIPEGTVRRIDLPQRPDQKVRVAMDLKPDTRRVIKKDSLASIRSEGLVGDTYVEISFGSEKAAPVSDSDTIQSEPPLQLSDLIKKANTILDSAQTGMQGLDNTVNNLSAISAKINQGRGTAGALINDRSIYQNASAAASSLQEDAEALKHNFLLRAFFKKRGYEDSADLTRGLIPRLPSEPPVKTFEYEVRKIFDKPDTAKLKAGKMLNEAGEYLRRIPSDSQSSHAGPI